MKTSIRWVFALIVAQFTALALAQQAPAAPAASEFGVAKPKLQFQFSPYTYHFSADTKHEHVYLAGVEREHPNGKLDGLVLFSNSFGQESAFLYPWGGVYHDVWGVKPLSFKWTAGLLYGYKEPYENKVPLNYKGFSPGVILALAYEFRPGWAAQVNLLGTAGLMFQINAPLN